jgi:hypothetical protein
MKGTSKWRVHFESVGTRLKKGRKSNSDRRFVIYEEG